MVRSDGCAILMVCIFEFIFDHACLFMVVHDCLLEPTLDESEQ